MHKSENEILTLAELQKQLAETRKEFELYRSTMEKRMMLQRDLIDRLSQTKTAIIARLSNSIRIPMNGVIGMIDILKQSQLNQEQSDYIHIIQSYSTQILAMITDLSDLSKIESDDIQIINQTCDIEEELDEVINGYKLRATGKGIGFNTNYDNLPSKVICDSHRVKQVISNLLSVALQGTKTGSISILTKCTARSKTSHSLDFILSDSSTGLTDLENSMLQSAINSKDYMSLLKLETWGINMAISFQLIQLMNGTVSYEVLKGRGNSFQISIPIGVPNSENPNISVVMNNDKTQNSLMILLVEDNLLNQKFAVATLVREGHKVDIAENGKIAVEKFKLNSYDLILMDIQMPVMDGIQATMKIREIERELNKTPIKIIAVTAYALDKDKVRCLAAGMDQFLAKPFKPQELVKLINNQ
jgi:CheY-like chemotaxis protein/signal transduction histidine kinase